MHIYDVRILLVITSQVYKTKKSLLYIWYLGSPMNGPKAIDRIPLQTMRIPEAAGNRSRGTQSGIISA